MDEIVVFITASSEEEAVKLGQRLVSQKLAACVNILPKVRSIFEWEGNLSEEPECLMVLKTTLKKFDDLEDMVKTLHTYDVPEIIALPIVKGSRDYLNWVQEMTKNA